MHFISCHVSLMRFGYSNLFWHSNEKKTKLFLFMFALIYVNVRKNIYKKFIFFLYKYNNRNWSGAGLKIENYQRYILMLNWTTECKWRQCFPFLGLHSSDFLIFNGYGMDYMNIDVRTFN